VPHLGEAIEFATVTAVHVAPGDSFKQGQTLVTLETDKAQIEMPAERAGCAVGVIVTPGSRASMGGILCACVAIETNGCVPTPAGAPRNPLVPREPLLDFIETVERRRATYEAAPPELLGALVARHTTAAAMLFGTDSVGEAATDARRELGFPSSNLLAGADALNVHLRALRLLLERHGQPTQFAPGAGEVP
jgi:pyruvate/2-oxoglutarate dehydrogenase complex dihydrolipoamide acyltransferase (E2) component